MMLFSVTLLYMLNNLHPIIPARHFHKDELEQQNWLSFKTQFNKMYGSDDEDSRRMKIYLENADKINKHNELFKKGEVSFRMAMNKFTDLTTEEFSQLYSSKKGVPSIRNDLGARSMKSFISSTPPEKMNWVERGVMTAVKDQGSCKCGWAFAAAAAIESQMAIKGKHLTDLSVQNLLDCARSVSPGFASDAFEYVKNKGMESEQDYPYEAEVNSCRHRSHKVMIRLKDYEYISNEGKEDKVKNFVGNYGPVTTRIHANASEFMSYKSGIFNIKSCSNGWNETYYELLVVGYDKTDKGEEYWLVRNSLGEGWGEKGYIKIARNLNNTCGIVDLNYFPVILED